MAEAAKNPSGGQGNAGQPASAGPEGAPSPKASLSQKAEELAARLEAHKNQAQAEAAKETVAREAARKEAVRLAMSGKSETAAQPEASKPAAQKAAPAKPAAAPPAQKPAAAKPAAPAAANKPAEGKTVAAKTAPAKPAAAKPAAKPQAKEPVEDVIRAIKLPHELEAEKKTASQPEAPATSVQPQAEEPATNTAQQVPPVSAAPKTGSLPTTKAAVAQARNRVFGSYEPEPEPSEAAVKRRVARERALNSKPPLGRTAQVIVALVFPLLTLIAAIRLIATPAFLALSYARPGFPSDSFGFTDAERLTYGSYGVDYLNNFAGREYLAGLKLSTGSSMFTEGEVQHMVDVKHLIGFAYVLGVVLAIILVIGVWYLAKRYAGGVRRALFSGAIVTLAMIAVLAVAALMGWETFFTQFHALFFSEGTWTFSVRDTLIRLYPEQFWVDSAIGIAALVLATVLVVLVSCWPTGRRRESSRLRQEARAFGIGN